jgi:transposase
MLIIGCDFHPSFQQLAILDNQTGGRFAGAKQVASYLGLTPREHSSGGKQRLGHISKQGSTLLRFLLVEAGAFGNLVWPTSAV